MRNAGGFWRGSALALLGSGLGFPVAGATTAAGPASVFPDPGLHDPRFHFHLGQVAHHHPVISPILPAMPFPPSDWQVGQWSQSSYMQGDRMIENDPRTTDPLLGIARYGFVTPDAHSHLWIYPASTPGSWVYELYEKDGIVKPGGGSNIFLGTNARAKDATFDCEIDYSVELKLSRAAVSYRTPTAKQTGAVLASIFTGFGIVFSDPVAKEHQFLFLQIPISSSKDTTHPGYYIFLPTKNRPNILYSAALHAGEATLPFQADPGPLHPFHYLLNRYVAQVVARPYKWNGRLVAWPAAAHDFKNWRLTGMYLGLETEAVDLRPKSITPDPQGSVEAALQVADLQVVRDPARPFDPAALGPAP